MPCSLPAAKRGPLAARWPVPRPSDTLTSRSVDREVSRVGSQLLGPLASVEVPLFGTSEVPFIGTSTIVV